MFIKWLAETVRTLGGPIVFLSSLYTFLGIGFLFVSPPVGTVLLGTGIVIAGLFVLLAYRRYRKEREIPQAD